METEGPLLETLTHRLGECPEEFLREPRIGHQGEIDVAALVCDLLRDLEVPLQNIDLESLHKRAAKTATNRLRLISIAVWLLHDPWFLERRPPGKLVVPLLFKELNRLAEHVPAGQFVTEPDRREELVRLSLKQLGLRPQGETAEQSADRLTSLDSEERARVVRQTRKAEARAREVREMMARRAAEEAAAKVSRE